jgi:dihydrofolate synthase/folylpolyglutamate synthase
MTALGLEYFADKKCEYVCLEVGLGGKNDPTNIVNPELSIIASIGLDHVELLGHTEEHIAK